MRVSEKVLGKTISMLLPITTAPVHEQRLSDFTAMMVIVYLLSQVTPPFIYSFRKSSLLSS